VLPKSEWEEVGSAVVILRLWRVFKIIEEFSTGAQEQMDSLAERIEELEKENDDLKRRLTHNTTSPI
jgi:voltage-gated hydrogen channel 1